MTPLSHQLREYLVLARREWRRLLLIVAGGTLLSVLVAFLWPPVYLARTTLLPPTEEETGFSVTSLIRGLSLPGVRVPSRTGPEDVALSVLESRRVKGAVVDSLGLVEYYGMPDRNAAIRELDDNYSAQVDQNGLLIITVTDGTPEMAARAANQFAQELDTFNREVRMTKGRRTREFVEERLAETLASMTRAERSLQAYQEQHKTVAVSPEQMSAIEAGAQLIARQAALQIRLGLARQYAAENSDEVRQLLLELTEVNRHVGELPDVGFELARKLRDLKIQEQMYVLLSAQYEEARINEMRDVATLDVLDTAEPPDKRHWPRRGLLVALGFLTSVLAAAFWLILSPVDRS